MFEDLKDKFKSLLKSSSGIKKMSLEELQEELLRAEVLQQISEISEVQKIITEIAVEVEKIDGELLNQKVRTIEQQMQRENLMAKKECYISVLAKFSVPNIDWIKEEIQKYEDK